MSKLDNELSQSKKDIAATIKIFGKSQALSKVEVDSLARTLNKIQSVLEKLADEKLDKKN